jgi:hypothetical protein
MLYGTQAIVCAIEEAGSFEAASWTKTATVKCGIGETYPNGIVLILYRILPNGDRPGHETPVHTSLPGLVAFQQFVLQPLQLC